MNDIIFDISDIDEYLDKFIDLYALNSNIDKELLESIYEYLGVENFNILLLFCAGKNLNFLSIDNVNIIIKELKIYKDILINLEKNDNNFEEALKVVSSKYKVNSLYLFDIYNKINSIDKDDIILKMRKE